MDGLFVFRPMSTHVNWKPVLVILYIFNTVVKGNDVTIYSSPKADVDEYSSIEFICTFTGTEKVEAATWKRNGVDIASVFYVSNNNRNCGDFIDPVDSELYIYTCGESSFSCKVRNTTRKWHGDTFQCFINAKRFFESDIIQIQVKVPVTSVQLKLQGALLTQNTLNVTEGIPVSLSCTPGYSFPEAKVDWFLNETPLAWSSNSYSYIAQQNHHGKLLFCKAYNDDSQIDSSKPTVYVKVRVTVVDLKHNNSKVTQQIVTVTSGVMERFSCEPGFSRPPASVDLYVGEAKRHSGNSTFEYVPADGDIDSKIYCKAHTTIENNIVESHKPKLYVQIKVLSVQLEINSIAITAPTVTITADVTVNFTCAPVPENSRPPPTTEWYIGINREYASNSTVLPITPKNHLHNKTIYCKAYNTQPPDKVVESYKKQLFVRVLAGQPDIINTTDGVLTLLHGDNSSIQCRSTLTRPAATITWSLSSDNVVIENFQKTEDDGLVLVWSTISFIAQKSDEGASIRCHSKIKNQTDTQTTTAKISVLWSPSTPMVTPVGTLFPWLEHHNGTLQCISNETGNPAATVVWLSRVGTEHTNEQLVINDLSSSHHDLPVKCQMENNFTVIKQKTVESPAIHLDVEYEPQISIKVDGNQTTKTFIAEGQTFKATCTAVGNPQPNSTWLNTNFSDGVLTYIDIDRRQSGNYTCVAVATSKVYTQMKFRAMEILEIIVRYPPSVLVTPESEQHAENMSLDITCTPFGVPNDYTYHGWTHSWKHTTLTSASQQNAANILHVSSLQLQDSGNYTCFVENGIKNRQGILVQAGATEILVEVAPKIFTTKMVYAGEFGKPFTIPIRIYAHPTLNTSTLLRKNNSDVQNLSHYSVSSGENTVKAKFYGKDVTLLGQTITFEIKELKEDDFDIYEAVFANSIGATPFTFKVIPESRPEQPKSFRFEGYQNLNLTFTWKQGFNGGHAQMFIIQISMAGQNIWLNKTIVEEYADIEKRRNGSYLSEISGLEPGTYDARLVARNKIGEAIPLELNVSIVIPSQEQPTTFQVAAAAGGGVGSAVLVVIIVGVVIYFRRKSSLKDTQGVQKTTLLGGHRRPENEDDLVEVKNPTYETADPIQSTSQADVLYTQVSKPKKQHADMAVKEKNDLYAQVQKPQKNDKSGKQKKERKLKQGKKTQHEDDKDGLHGTANEGMVYENADTYETTVTESENAYELTQDVAAIAKPSRTQNQDGLIYVQVDLPYLKDGSDKKAIIHGIDNKSEYADIAFGKIGEQAPESDEEEKPNNKES